MVLAETLILVSMLAFQAAGISPATADLFNTTEKVQMAAATSLDGRIKVYDAASRRIHTELQETVRKEQFEAVPNALKTWMLLLQTSLEDIEANTKPKKKSKKLIKYEIHLRKAINDTLGFKLKAPVEQHDAFNSCIAQAEAVRKRFIDLLFKH